MTPERRQQLLSTTRLGRLVAFGHEQPPDPIGSPPVTFGFNPDQERASNGKFGSGGASGGAKKGGDGAKKDKATSKGTKGGDENGLKVTGRKPGTISEKDFVKSLDPASKAKLAGPKKTVGDHGVVGHLLKEVGKNAGLRNAIHAAHNGADIKKHLSKYKVEHQGGKSLLHVGKGARPNAAIKALVQGAAKHPELRKHLEAAANRNPHLRAGLDKSIGKGVKREIDKAVGKAVGKPAKKPKPDISQKDFVKSLDKPSKAKLAAAKKSKSNTISQKDFVKSLDKPSKAKLAAAKKPAGGKGKKK